MLPATCCRSTAPVRRCSPLPRQWCSRSDVGGLVLSAPIRSIRSTKARRCWPAPSPHYLPCLEDNGFNPDFDAVPAKHSGSAAQILFLCSPGNPTGALTYRWRQLKKLIALADELRLRDRRRRVLQRTVFRRRESATRPAQRLRRAGPPATSSAAWCSIACPSAPTCRACAPASSPAMPRFSKPSCSIAPITAAPCRYRPSWPASPPGRTRPTCAPIATSTAPSTTRCWRSWQPVLDVQRPDGSFYLWARTPARRHGVHPRAVRPASMSPWCRAPTCHAK